MVNLNDLRIEKLPEHLKALAASGQRQADISLAAGQLVRLRHEAQTRPPRVYTGRVFGRRAWRGMPVILPTGRVGALYKAMRGAAVVTWRDEFALRPDQHVALDVAELQRFKLPAAVVLGRLKAGRQEKPSKVKARACRRNGHQPPRQGSRPRGRPRGNQAADMSSGRSS